MAYTIDGETYKQVAERKFASDRSLKKSGADGCDIPFVQHVVQHVYSENFGVVQFKADFQKDINIKNVRDVEHVSIHFQLKGTSKANFKGIKDEHPLFAGDYNMYYSNDFNSDLFFKAQTGFEYLAITLKKDYLCTILAEHGNLVARIEHLLGSGIPFALADKAMPMSPAIAHALHSLMNCPVADGLASLYMSSKVTEIVALQLAQYQGVVPFPVLSLADDRKLLDVIACIDKDFLKDLSISELADAFSLSENQLKQGLVKKYNTTFYELLHHKRMQYARQALVCSDRNVNEIAWETGYANASNFILAFKRMFHTTPKKYKLQAGNAKNKFMG